jgi:cobalt/nickel transport system permease protein
MNLAVCDRCAHTGRWAGRQAAERLWPSLAALALTVALPAGPGHLLVAGALVAATLYAGVRPLDWLRIAAGPLLFLAVAVLPLAVAVHLWPLRINWAGDGGLRVLATGSRALAALTILLFIACTVPMPALVANLRACGCPAVVTDLMLLIYRQIFVLADTLEHAGIATCMRGGKLSLRARWRSLGAQAATLLRRGWERARRWELGLRARGWEDDLHWAVRRRTRPWQVAIRVVAAAALIAASILGPGPWPQ